jgi:hypothetical protein
MRRFADFSPGNWRNPSSPLTFQGATDLLMVSLADFPQSGGKASANPRQL